MAYGCECDARSTPPSGDDMRRSIGNGHRRRHIPPTQVNLCFPLLFVSVGWDGIHPTPSLCCSVAMCHDRGMTAVVSCHRNHRYYRCHHRGYDCLSVSAMYYTVQCSAAHASRYEREKGKNRERNEEGGEGGEEEGRRGGGKEEGAEEEGRRGEEEAHPTAAVMVVSGSRCPQRIRAIPRG